LIDKSLPHCDQVVACIRDGDTIMLGGFGNAGMPGQLIEALRLRQLKGLTIISNGGGTGPFALGALIGDGAVSKLIATFPAPSAVQFRELYLRHEIELELVPQGTLVERIRAAGAGLGGFYTPAGVGTDLAKGQEVRVIEGREYVFALPLRADHVFLKAHLGDRFGNLVYRGTMRNFNMVMATAGRNVAAEVDRLVPAGELPAEHIHTPGIFVDHLVEVARHPKLLELPREEN
jgi:3-oxoadipate CoA-transferase alpha subunit